VPDVPDLPPAVTALLKPNRRNASLGFFRLRESFCDERTTEYAKAVFLCVPDRIQRGDAGGGKGAGVLALSRGAQQALQLLVYRAEAGRVFVSGDRRLTPSQLQKQYYRVGDAATARRLWEAAYRRSAASCRHMGCRTPGCQIGRRVQEFHVLTGAMLPIWSELSAVVAAHAALRTDDSGKQVKVAPQLRVVHIEAAAAQGDGQADGGGGGGGGGEQAASSSSAGAGGGGAAAGRAQHLLGLLLPIRLAPAIVAQLRAKFRGTLMPPPPAAAAAAAAAPAAAALQPAGGDGSGAGGQGGGADAGGEGEAGSSRDGGGGGGGGGGRRL
jgi:hypothetical protein